MRNAASIARGTWSETKPPRKALTSALRLMSPRPSVTGSMSAKTRRIRGSRQSSDDQSHRKPTVRRTGTAMPNCTAVPARTPIAYA